MVNPKTGEAHFEQQWKDMIYRCKDNPATLFGSPLNVPAKYKPGDILQDGDCKGLWYVNEYGAWDRIEGMLQYK